MKKRPRPIHEWSIPVKLGRRTGRVVVRVFRTVEEMAAAHAAYRGQTLRLARRRNKNGNRAVGCAMEGPFLQLLNHRWRIVNEWAHLLLVKDEISSNYVAHEVQHAVLYAAVRFGFFQKILREREKGRNGRPRWARQAEEALCRFAGNLNALMWRKWYRYARRKKRKEG